MANLDNVNYFAEYSFEDQVLQNVITFIKYGLLEIGAFYNIRRGQSDAVGNDASRLRPVGIQGIQNYTIYGGLKSDWIWESGISLKYNGELPISISGIWVNNSFIPNGTKYAGTGWYINYNNGWVVFNHPIQSTGMVQVEHSLRAVGVYSCESKIYKNIINNYMNRDDWNAMGSGIDNNNYNYRAYLPALFVDIISYNSEPMEIGTRNKWANATLSLNSVAMTPEERKRISDICLMLEDKSFTGYNINNAPRPLSVSGTINSGALTWPNLTTNYPIGPLRFLENASFSRNTNNLVSPIQQSRVTIDLEFPVII